MVDLILIYILGALINSWFICTWFFTSLPLHLFHYFIPQELEVDSWDEWNSWLLCENEFMAELLSCPLCLGFWSSLLVGTLVAWANDLSVGFIFAGWFSWPLISFIIYKKMEK